MLGVDSFFTEILKKAGGMRTRVMLLQKVKKDFFFNVRVPKKVSRKEENFFFNNLFKIGYSKKIPSEIGKIKYFKELVKTFQRRFRQELVDGKIDQECLLISKNLIKSYN